MDDLKECIKTTAMLIIYLIPILLFVLGIIFAVDRNLNMDLCHDYCLSTKKQRIKMEHEKYNHYFKPCPYDKIDIYRVLRIFNVTDPCIAHAIKKLMVAGGRGEKSIEKDIQEAIDSLNRWKDMRGEEFKFHQDSYVSMQDSITKSI